MLQRLIRRLEDRTALLDAAIEIQQVAAPTFAEGPRSALVRRHYSRLGLQSIAQDELGNVYACRPGRTAAPGIMLAAHLDTVFSQETDLTIRREGGRIYGPGLGDNSLGVAAIIQLASALQAIDAPNVVDIWFVADVGEEGLGNLRGMRAAVDRLGDRVDGVIAVEGFGFGRIYNRAISVRRLQIEARAPGGHSWADYGAPSAIHLLVQVAAAIVGVPITDNPRSTLNIGVLEGGTSVNAIAEVAKLLLDLRSEDQAALEALAASVRRAIDSVPVPSDASITSTIVGQRDGGAIPEHHPLATAAAEALRAEGATVVWGSGSTDANVPLARGIPAICVGVTEGGNAHRIDEYIETEPLPRGMAALGRLVWRLACSTAEIATTP